MARAAMLVCSGLLAQAAAQAPVVVAGSAFEVHCHGGDERVAMQALATVEPVWTEVCEVFGASRPRPDELLQVHLYLDVEGYRAADRRLTGGRFGPNQAMSHWESKSAHVALQPACSDALLTLQGLPMQTQAMLAWEACHISRYALCDNFRVHPGWFYDGLAASVARRALRARFPDLGPQPFFTQRWLRSRRLAEGGELPGLRQLLAGDTRRLQMRDRYAARVAFFEFALQQRPDAVRELARKVRSTAAGTGYTEAVTAAALAALRDLERAFQARALRAAPEWDEQVRSLWAVGGEWRQRAFAAVDAVAWRTEPARGPAFRVAGEVSVRAQGPGKLRLLFGRSAEGCYALELRAGVGLALLDLSREGSVRGTIASGPCEELVPDAWCAFAISVEAGRAALRVGGRSMQVELPRPLLREVEWGLSAVAGGAGELRGSAGSWRGVQADAR